MYLITKAFHFLRVDFKNELTTMEQTASYDKYNLVFPVSRESLYCMTSNLYFTPVDNNEVSVCMCIYNMLCSASV